MRLTAVRDKYFGFEMGMGSLCVAFALFLLCPVAGRAADDNKAKEPDEQVYELTADMTPPKLVRRVDPEYSPGSKGVRVEGSVLIGTVITSRGIPKDPHVVRSLDKDVDQVAVDAVKQWLFSPAKKDGKPVAVNVTIEITFHAL
jgi:TonB family protein